MCLKVAVRGESPEIRFIFCYSFSNSLLPAVEPETLCNDHSFWLEVSLERGKQVL